MDPTAGPLLRNIVSLCANPIGTRRGIAMWVSLNWRCNNYSCENDIYNSDESWGGKFRPRRRCTGRRITRDGNICPTSPNNGIRVTGISWYAIIIVLVAAVGGGKRPSRNYTRTKKYTLKGKNTTRNVTTTRKIKRTNRCFFPEGYKIAMKMLMITKDLLPQILPRLWHL